MKIRIKGNSIRIRLSKSELELFATEGYIMDQTDFGNNVFSYAVKSLPGENLSADFSNNTITIVVPQHLLDSWASTNLVGLEYNFPVNKQSLLHLLLEKDFKCIDPPMTEDQSDYFENPQLVC